MKSALWKTHLKVIGHIVVFASWSSEKPIAWSSSGGLIGWRGLGVPLFIERIALGNILVFRVCCHLDEDAVWKSSVGRGFGVEDCSDVAGNQESGGFVF